ncbi:MAG: LolA family protein [Fibrobacterota bacterium]
MKTFLIFLTAVFSLRAGITDADSIVNSLIQSRNTVRTLSCRIKVFYEETGRLSRRFEGEGYYKKSDGKEKLILNYFSPAREHFISRADTVIYYAPENKTAMVFDVNKSGKIDREILKQSGRLVDNTLRSMRDSYNFSIKTTVGDSALVLEAEPKGGWVNFSAIYVKVNKNKNALTVIEIYGKDGSIVSQTVFSDFEKVPGTDYFFPSVRHDFAAAGTVPRKIKTIYSRLVFNEPVSDSVFYPEIPEDVKYIRPGAEQGSADD